jgi:hypothetical protein
MVDRLINWLAVDPEVTLLMLIAIAIFASVLTRMGLEGSGFWPLKPASSGWING